MMNEQELKEYQEYLASQGFTPEESQAYMQETGVLPPESSLGAKALDAAGRVLDYGSGIGRTLVKQVASPYSMKEDEWESALKGKAQSGEQILKDLGVEEGARVNYMPEIKIPMTDVTLGEGDTSERDLKGMALEIAADPLTYLTFGASAAARMAKAGKIAKDGKLAKVATKADNLLSPVRKTQDATGKKIWKSGFKRIDQEVDKYGKDPVSDVLIKHNVAGNGKHIAKEMDRIGKELLEKRNAVLRKAAKDGAEVSMKEAMAPTLAEIQKIRVSRDPNLRPLAKALTRQAKEYIKLDAKLPEDYLKELPVQSTYKPAYTEIDIKPKSAELIDLPVASEYVPSYSKIDYEPPKQTIRELVLPGKNNPYVPNPKTKTTTVFDETPGQVLPGEVVPEQYVSKKAQVGYFETPAEVIPGKTVPEQYIPNKPQIALDTTEYVPGPDPLTASGYKTSLAGKVPDSAWRDPKFYKTAKDAEKASVAGMRKAVEESVRRTNGDAAAKELIDTNDELGRILTSKEKQAQDAAREALKDNFTSVDGLAAINPKMLALKKTADAMKSSAVRTKTGRWMVNNAADPISGPMWDILLRRQVTDGLKEDEKKSPWNDVREKR